MTPVKLSICIATRNRAHDIAETLDSLFLQMTDEVELVIVDGASTDDTEAVVRSYQPHLPRMRYERREVNGGFDRDYSRAVELAQGDFCWLMTDDDTFRPNAVQTILRHVQNDYSLLIVNAENRTADQSEVILERRLAIETDRVYRPDESEALFAEAGYYLSYIGGVVIRRALWAERNKESYWDTWFVHFGVIFQKPLPGPVLVLAEPLINGRIGNISWNERSFEIWMFRWPELVWSMPFTDQAKAKITPREPWRNLKALLIHRGDGSYSLAMHRRWMASRAAPRWYQRAAQVIAVLPPGAVWLLVYIHYRLFRPQAHTALYHWLHVPVAKRWFGWLARAGARKAAS